MILGNLLLPVAVSEKSEMNYEHTYQPFLVKKPHWEEAGRENYQNQTHSVLNNLLKCYDGPEFIPALSEMFSKMLVISAEQNFETSKPNLNKKKKQFPGFSKEHISAY